MKRLLAALVLLLGISLPAHGRERVSGWCEQGGNDVTVGGLTSTEDVQESFASCTVTVYDVGTLDIASIFSDDSGTVKANPFTASSTGFWFFLADDARYDLRFSGGGIVTPFTIGDILLNDTKNDVATIVSVASSATPTFDASLGTIFTNTLTANVTSLTISNPVTGQRITLYLVQDGTGGWTFAWPANVQLRGGGYVVSDDVSAVSVVNLYYDGTNWRETASDADEVGRDLMPTNNATQNLGESANRWNNIFGQILNIAGASTLTGNIGFGGTLIPDATGQNIGSTSARPDIFADVVEAGDWNDIPVVGSTKYPATQTGLEAARDSLPSTGGLVLLQEGNLNLTTNFDADNGKQNVCYIGRGSFGNFDVGSSSPATSFTWTGSAGGTMVSFAPTAGASNQSLKSSCLIGVMLDAANLAAIALEVRSARNSKFTDLFLKDCTTTCLDLDVVATLGEARDPQHNDFRNISIRNVTAASGIGIRLDGDATANSSLNRFDNIFIIHDDGVGIHLIQSDTNTWSHIRVFRNAGGTGVGVLLDSTDATEHARNEYFFMLHSGAGGLTQQNDATDNVIFGYDRGNANPAPTISAGELHYIEMGVSATTWRVPETIVLRPSGTGNTVASEQLQLIGRDSGGVERITAIQADPDGDLRVSPLSGKAIIVGGGININGGGVKHTRIASGTTAASLHATASATWTFTTAFADTSYTIACTVDNPTGVPLVANTDTKAAASINIVIMAGSSAAASGTLNCIAVHD